MTTYTGTSGDDVWNGASANDTAFGADGNDSLTGGLGDDYLSGDNGDDLLVGNKGNDTLLGGAGRDIFQFSGASQGFDSVDGGGGLDTLNVTSNNAAIGLVAISSVELIDAGTFTNASILGSAGDDVLNFTNGKIKHIVLVDAGDGNDAITSSLTSDTIHGGNGDDVFYYSTASAGFDSLDGGAGVDRIVATENNTVIGLSWVSSADIEAIDATGFTGVSILGSAGGDGLHFTNMTLTNITLVDGGAGNDSIDGSLGADTLRGGDGDDLIYGDDGNDVIDGGAGADKISYSAGDGADHVDGGLNLDTIYLLGNNLDATYSYVDGIEAINTGAYTHITISGAAGGDFLNFSGVTVTGSNPIDLVIGSDGDDTIYAPPALLVVGGLGFDHIYGSDQDDHFLLQANDTIDGGLGADTLWVPSASVTPAGANRDVIIFHPLDTIDLSDIDAIPSTFGDDTFHWMGTSAFDGNAGELRVSVIGGGVYVVQGDLNGDRVADMEIEVHSSSTPSAGDFIL